ncbi:MAG: MBL fold metallo-hydrolase, partial [Giesbergeria sp.]
GGGAFLPVHWGTFNLAMHDWDEPAETLLARAPAQGAHLLMPRLGDPVEPAHGPLDRPWWRELGAVPPVGAKAPKDPDPPAQAPEQLEPLLWPMD